MTEIGIGQYRYVVDNGVAEHIHALERERDALLAMTRQIDEHPEGYDGPCECKLCLSYAAEDK